MKRNTAILAAALCFLLCARAVNINIMPRNLTVQEGQYANFTCEVPCSHSAYWYVGDLYNSAPLPYTDVVPGITYTRSIIGPCAPSAPGNYTDRISILATADLDRIAVQCSASRIICDANDASCGDIVYSRFRTLRVERRPVPSSSSSPMPSPTPAVDGETTSCPSPSPVVETTTSIVTETETVTTTETLRSVSTVTETTTSIVMVTETVSPIPTHPSAGTPNSAYMLKSVGLFIVPAVIVVLSVVLLL